MFKSLFVVASVLCLSSAALSDTIKLKNGNVIYGKVVRHSQDPKVPADKVRVAFKNGGWMLIREADINHVIVDDEDHFDRRSK